MSDQKEEKKASSAPTLVRSDSLSLSKRLEMAKSQEGLAVALSQLDLGPRGRLDMKDDEEALDPQAENRKLQQEIELLAGQLERQAFHIIFVVFPRKIAKLDSLWKRDPRFIKSSEEVKASGPLPSIQDGDEKRPVVKVSKSGEKELVVPCNQSIVDLCDALKNEILLLGEYMSTLSVWIQLNVPRLSDNVQFSQEVQMELLGQIQSAEGVATEVLGDFANYHLSRAELICKIIKYPGVKDYRKSVEELDDKTYLKVSQIAAQVRTLYLVLFDLLSKNLQMLLSDASVQDKAASGMYY